MFITVRTKYLQEDYDDITILVANTLKFIQNPYKFIY